MAYMQARQNKITAFEAKLIANQKNEMNALKKKLESRMNERLKFRDVEHNKILQRYANVKKEIQNQQNLERIDMERKFNKRPGTATSRSQMGTSKMGASKMGRSTASQRGVNAPASRPSVQ